MDWQAIMAIGGGILLFGNIGALIYKWVRPALGVKKDVEILKEHDRKDFETLKEIQAMNVAQSKAMMQILNHMIDGNGVEEMKKTRKMLMDLTAGK